MKKIIFIAIAALIALSANATDLEKVEKVTTQGTQSNYKVTVFLHPLPKVNVSGLQETYVWYQETSSTWLKKELYPSDYGHTFWVRPGSEIEFWILIGIDGIVNIDGQRFYAMDYSFAAPIYRIDSDREIHIWIERLW